MISESLLKNFKERLAETIGLNFSGKGWRDFEARITAAARDAGADTPTFIDQVLAAPLTKSTTQMLARHLTVGETYFFRDQPGFEALTTHLLPDLLRRREANQRRLRIWSAGCCTGEEAYSIAILLDRLLPDQKSWDILIKATDINEDFLQLAQDGVYGEWSFRGTPDWVRRGYFKKKRNGTFELLPKIRERVKFSYLNLADEVYPSLSNETTHLDFIFCRNVLMYFSHAQQRRIITRFHSALTPEGILSVSPAETSAKIFNNFSAVNFPGAIFYQREQPSQQHVISTESVKNPLPSALRYSPKPKAARIKAAVVHSAKANPIAPSPEILKNAEESVSAARTCANEGRLDDAIKWCAKAIAADKLNPAYQYLLATIEQERGMYPEAIQALQRTLYLDQDFVLAHFALANLRLTEGRPADAQRHLATVKQLLKNRAPEEVLPESDGLTVNGLDDIVASLIVNLAELSPTKMVKR